MTDQPLNILILGASYGLLPGVKLALAGHRVTFVGQAEEIRRMQSAPLSVTIPLRKSGAVAQLVCDNASFTVPELADPAAADFIILAMQEPQFANPQVADLARRVGASGKPCLSIMNLPPPPFLARLDISPAALKGVYSAMDVWESFDPQRISNASPDPQALRMDADRPGALTVTLASNFKAAPFAHGEDQRLLEQLARDMSRLKIDVDGSMVAPPVRLLAHSSPFIPLAKWPMLIAGNCRCVQADGICTIAEAVLADSGASKAIYDQVCDLVLALGAEATMIVPFSAYAAAAQQLVRPSSAARALENGAVNIERIDRLVLQLMEDMAMETQAILPIVDCIENRLAANRAKG